MSKTPSYTAKEIVKMLVSRGFVLDRMKGSHHIYMLPDGTKRSLYPYTIEIFRKELVILS